MIPARCSWAVRLLDPGPAERLLEVGCGPGVAAGLVCDRLTTGSLLAVDRSATAIARTSERNAAHLAAGRLTTHRAALADLDRADFDRADFDRADFDRAGFDRSGFDRADFDRAGFDAAFTIDVNVFWTAPTGPDIGILARLLKPGGRLLVLYGANTPAPADRITAPIALAMAAAGLTDIRVVTGDGGFGVTGRADLWHSAGR